MSLFDIFLMGIGLAMVAHATQILNEAGCDKSFIHYTALDKWYGRLGYETCMAFALGEKSRGGK